MTSPVDLRASLTMSLVCLILYAMTASTFAEPPRSDQPERRLESDESNPSDHEVTVQQVLDTWQDRRRSTTSFHYEYQQKTTLANVQQETDPFGRVDEATSSIVRERVGLERSVSLTMSDGRTAFQSSGGQWRSDLNTRVSTRHVETFDGTIWRRFIQGGGRKITLGKIKEASKPSINGSNQLGIWMTHSPQEWLTEITAFRPEASTINPTPVTRDDRKCLEMTLTTNNARWRIRLYIDPSRDYLPVELTQEFDGVLRGSTVVKHAADDPWRVDSWVYRRYDNRGREEETSYVKVIGSKINSAHDDDDFDLEFPVGAHVVEDIGGERKHFISLGNGKGRYIRESEYGRVPRAKP